MVKVLSFKGGFWREKGRFVSNKDVEEFLMYQGITPPDIRLTRVSPQEIRDFAEFREEREENKEVRIIVRVDYPQDFGIVSAKGNPLDFSLNYMKVLPSDVTRNHPDINEMIRESENIIINYFGDSTSGLLGAKAIAEMFKHNLEQDLLGGIEITETNKPIGYREVELIVRGNKVPIGNISWVRLWR